MSAQLLPSAPASRRLPARHFRAAFALCMAAPMVLVVTGSVTLANFGLHDHLLTRWLRAFLIAYPIAAAAIYVLAPRVGRFVASYVETPPGG